MAQSHKKQTQINYDALGQEEFDAIVTGELTHYAIWMEGELNNIICDYFEIPNNKAKSFKEIILLRDGLNAQDKIEIVRFIILSHVSDADVLKEWKKLLIEIEEFKSYRNAMAHGMDVTSDPYQGVLKISIVGRNGNEKIVEITPSSHQEMSEKAEKMLERMRALFKKLDFCLSA